MADPETIKLVGRHRQLWRTSCSNVWFSLFYEPLYHLCFVPNRAFPLWRGIRDLDVTFYHLCNLTMLFADGPKRPRT